MKRGRQGTVVEEAGSSGRSEGQSDVVVQDDEKDLEAVLLDPAEEKAKLVFEEQRLERRLTCSD